MYHLTVRRGADYVAAPKAPAAAKEVDTNVSLTKTDGKTVKLAGKVTG